jgi:hypothetical protein
MRTSLLATTIFLALFGGVSAQGTKPPDAYFVLVPNAETLSSQIVGLEVYNKQSGYRSS